MFSMLTRRRHRDQPAAAGPALPPPAEASPPVTVPAYAPKLRDYIRGLSETTQALLADRLRAAGVDMVDIPRDAVLEILRSTLSQSQVPRQATLWRGVCLAVEHVLVDQPLLHPGDAYDVPRPLLRRIEEAVRHGVEPWPLLELAFLTAPTDREKLAALRDAMEVTAGWAADADASAIAATMDEPTFYSVERVQRALTLMTSLIRAGVVMLDMAEPVLQMPAAFFLDRPFVPRTVRPTFPMVADLRSRFTAVLTAAPHHGLPLLTLLSALLTRPVDVMLVFPEAHRTAAALKRGDSPAAQAFNYLLSRIERLGRDCVDQIDAVFLHEMSDEDLGFAALRLARMLTDWQWAREALSRSVKLAEGDPFGLRFIDVRASVANALGTVALPEAAERLERSSIAPGGDLDRTPALPPNSQRLKEIALMRVVALAVPAARRGGHSFTANSVRTRLHSLLDQHGQRFRHQMRRFPEPERTEAMQALGHYLCLATALDERSLLTDAMKRTKLTVAALQECTCPLKGSVDCCASLRREILKDQWE